MLQRKYVLKIESDARNIVLYFSFPTHSINIAIHVLYMTLEVFSVQKSTPKRKHVYFYKIFQLFFLSIYTNALYSDEMKIVFPYKVHTYTYITTSDPEQFLYQI